MTNAEQQYDITERDAVRADLEREARDDITVITGEGADLVALTEERFGPLPQREPGAAGKRLQFIAVLHAMIQFLIDNPDLPCPWTTGMSFKVSDTLALAAMADRFGVAPINNAYGIPQQVSVFDLFGRDFYVPVSFRVADELDRPL